MAYWIWQFEATKRILPHIIRIGALLDWAFGPYGHRGAFCPCFLDRSASWLLPRENGKIA